MPVPGFALLSYACTVEPLRAANLLSRKPLFDITIFSSDENTQSSGEAFVGADKRVGDLPELDIFLVIAGGDPFSACSPALLNWLSKMATRVPLVGGVSGGPVLLAKAGLMTGKRMTVHWEHATELAQECPDANIERRLYVFDRDRVTCGGGTAPMDMMHAIIFERLGAEYARMVSDWFLHTEIRASTAPQLGFYSADLAHLSPNVAEAVLAMENHVADPLSLAQIALMSEVSVRHLNRLFHDAFGTSAMAFYRARRLDVGRRLVTHSKMKIADIAEATGFATPSHFSKSYHAQFGVPPLVERLDSEAAAEQTG